MYNVTHRKLGSSSSSSMSDPYAVDVNSKILLHPSFAPIPDESEKLIRELTLRRFAVINGPGAPTLLVTLALDLLPGDTDTPEVEAEVAVA